MINNPTLLRVRRSIDPYKAQVEKLALLSRTLCHGVYFPFM